MDTREKLKTILGEWREYQPPRLYQRRFDASRLQGPEILSIIGARRAGKTFLCYQIIEALKKTLPPENIIYVNLEDERLYPLHGDELSLLWDTILELFSPHMDKRVFLFVDEVHNVANWSKWARRMTEHHRNLKLVITGSSSKLLSREIATELRGRTLSHTVYPLHFREYLNAKAVGCEPGNLLYSKRRSVFKKQFNDYFRHGGFPATLESAHPDELLKEYYRVMFSRDIIERHKVKNTRLLEDYLNLLIDQSGAYASISATAKKLTEFGHSFSKNTLSNFSRYAEDAFLAFEVKKHSFKIREQLKNPKKIYTIDHGLMQAIRFSSSWDYGRILENLVYIALRQQEEEVYYEKGARECDFVIARGGKITQAIQVTKTLSGAKTRERELGGLAEAMSRYKLGTGLILTEDQHETLNIRGAAVRVLPVWCWLLETG